MARALRSPLVRKRRRLRARREDTLEAWCPTHHLLDAVCLQDSHRVCIRELRPRVLHRARRPVRLERTLLVREAAPACLPRRMHAGRVEALLGHELPRRDLDRLEARDEVVRLRALRTRVAALAAVDARLGDRELGCSYACLYRCKLKESIASDDKKKKRFESKEFRG